jgi:hypothetical protein
LFSFLPVFNQNLRKNKKWAENEKNNNNELFNLIILFKTKLKKSFLNLNFFIYFISDLNIIKKN